MNDDAAFLEASRQLTGLESLPPFLAAVYRDRVASVHGSAALSRLLDVPKDALLATLEEDDELRAVAESVVMLWYASATVDASGTFTFGTPRQYFSSQLWQVIRAHPPGLSGGYMGHWRYPPE